MIPGSSNPLLAFSASQYQISRSLRFNALDSAYLSRTFGAPTAQGTFTFSAWVKRSNLGTTQQLFGVSTNHVFGFTATDALSIVFGGASPLTTAAVFRDPAAWYHVVWTQNGSAHTIYVNNDNVGAAAFTYSGVFNTAVPHQIAAGNTTSFLDGYLAEVHFIDGQSLAPSAFGKADAVTGEWVPIGYSGAYGNNGFKLNFRDNSAATAVALGKDQAGSNDWTPNNLSVAAGAANDSLVDSPTSFGTDTGAGGEVRGNYCVLSPNATPTTFGSYGRAIPQNGGLELTQSSGRAGTGTIAMTSGKWYAEVVFAVAVSSAPNEYPLCGVCRADYNSNSLATFPGYDADGIGIDYTGKVRNQGTITATYTAFSSTDIGMIAYDASTGKVWFGRNGTWFAAGNPAAGANPIATATWFASGAYFCCNSFSTSRAVWNFGQRPFSYTAPAGFKALCDTNLTAAAIARPSSVMDVVSYIGDGASRSVSGLGFSPSLVWIKSRSSGTYLHNLIDAARGGGLRLSSDSTAAENDGSAGGATPLISSFNADGFTLPNANLNTNQFSATYVAWCWSGGGTGVSNTNGSIPSTVRANTAAGFSVITYTGNGVVNATVGHGLGTAPAFIVVKARSAVSAWNIYTTAIDGSLDYFDFGTAAKLDATQAVPTSAVFSVSNAATVNGLGTTYVAYCWAPVDGYSAIGTYTGNGQADGPMVHTAFRSRFIMVKQATAGSATGWVVLDSARLGYNPDNKPLFANTSAAEALTNPADIVSTGLKIRSADASLNASGGTYLCIAFAESPFAYSRAR